MERMKVAVITSGYLPVPPTKGGAVENIIYNLVKKNEKYGECLLTIYSIIDCYSENFRNTNVEYINVPALVQLLDKILYFIAKYILKRKHLISYRYFFQRIEFYKMVGKELFKNDYDRVLLENNVVMFRALCYKDNFRKYKDKIVYHAHNELGKTLGYEKYLNNLKNIIGVSDYITDKYKKYIQNSNVDFRTIHNAIDENVFSKGISESEIIRIKNDLGIENDWPVLLYTGRISEEKGILELIKALSSLDTERYNLLVVGKSFYGTNIKDVFEDRLQLEAQNIKGNVIFTGLIEYEDMYKYYKLADLCILPSVWNEPCALTVIECIVCGTPLITTKTGGTPENITSSTIMVDTDNIVNDLASIIRTMIENPAQLKELKKKTKKEIYKHGTLDDYYFNFVNALK